MSELYHVGGVVSDTEHDAVLRDLVIRHPRADEKIGPGVEEIFRWANEFWRPQVCKTGQTGIWIRDVEGNPRDILGL